jgi:transposase
MGYITADREQIGIIAYSLTEFVDEQSKSRFIAKLIKEIDLRELHGRYSSQGGEAYDPEIMLGILFLGYSEGITSSRKLERACKKDMDFIYISANLRPDHSSISRFRKNHIDLLSKYFVEIVKIGKKRGIGEFKIISQDGTKIQAYSSKRKSYREYGIDRYIAGVEKDIEEYLKKSEETDEEEKIEIGKEIRKLNKKREVLKERRETLIERKAELQSKDRDNHQINIVEPDAKMMMHSGGKGMPSYNAQIGVDTKSGIIVSNDVVQERNDEKQFARQYENTERNLGKDEVRKYIADSGYSSFDEIVNTIEKDIDAYIGDPRNKEKPKEEENTDKTFTKEGFIYDKGSDCYKCPNNKILHYSNSASTKRGELKTYKTSECKECKYLDRCHTVKSEYGKYKKILRDKREAFADLMREKMSGKVGEEMMKLRAQTVEPVFGNLKSNLGFKRFRMSGLNNVRGEFNLMCIAHNINKLFYLLLFLGYLNILKRKNALKNLLGRFTMKK